ncbi:MAG TPA: hypothetical protein VGM14_20230 [Streptosporangiaceae bacterium]
MLPVITAGSARRAGSPEAPGARTIRVRRPGVAWPTASAAWPGRSITPQPVQPGLGEADARAQSPG